MQVGILGPLEVRDFSGAKIEITGARLRALLVRLALDAGRPVPATALVAAVWGAHPPADETNALQTLISRLRRVLADPALIAQSAAGYRLEVDPVAVDATRFETLTAIGSRALRAGDPHTAARVLREALQLWRGAAVTDAAETLATTAMRLTDLRVAAVFDRVSADIALGHAEVAVPELEALSVELPLDERVATQLVTALASSGRQADALRAYARVRARLAEELGVDPSAELKALYLAVLRGDVVRDEAVSPRGTSPQRRTNLKAQLTSFIGGENEVARVATLLAGNRLVTLVGPGGAGKTRLATEAGATLAAADGVWLAELAPVTDRADLAPAVLGALGFREKQLLERRPGRGAQDASSRLLEALADKDIVLVLDNCEHLIDASAQLAGHLLEQCPQLRVLATSREPLGITGEVVLALPPLGQPAVGLGFDEAAQYPAVRLFADRAAAARPDFAVDEATIATVIDIVRRLDGLPLAIELAAARLRTMSVTDIADRLSDRFRLLTGGSRIALPRHRTLRAVVEWSWDLLTEPERRLTERLAIFPAGATTESAAAVCADDAVPAEDVPELLASLIDKSLLQRVGSGQRARMLETIREYGIERLVERGELSDLRRRHSDYFDSLLERAEPFLISAAQLPWFDRLTDERENIVAALRFRCDTGDADGALSIAVSLSSFAMMLGNHSDIPSWTSDALAVDGWTDESLYWVATGLYAMHAASIGTDPARVGDGTRTLRAAADHTDLIRSTEHPMFGVMRVAVAFFANDIELTIRVLEEELANPSEWMRAAARMFRANLAENEGDPESMREDVETAIVMFRRLGERWGLANSLRSRALLATIDGDLVGAERAYAEALDLMAQLKSADDEAFLLVRMADLAVRQGDTERGREMMERAHERAELAGSGVEAVFTLSMLADFERQAGNTELARAMHADAMQRMSAVPAEHPAQAHGRAIVSALAARFCFDEGGELALTRRYAEMAYTAAIATRDSPILAAVGVLFAEIAAAAGDCASAANVLGAAARVRGSDDPSATEIRRLTDELRGALGVEAFESGYNNGKSLDRDAAMKRIDPAEALASL